MALTETQKTKVRMYLGWERGYELNSKLEDKLVSFSATEETEVVTVLTRIAALETRIDARVSGDFDAVKEVDEIVLRDTDPLASAYAHGRRLVAQLTALLGVDCNWGKEYFSDGSGPIAASFHRG
jgi:hypothetical protein